MLKVERRIDKKYFNCNNCGVTNFESKWNEKVDYLTHIAAENGSNSYIAMRLCDKCLKKLCQQINEVIDSMESDR